LHLRIAVTNFNRFFGFYHILFLIVRLIVIAFTILDQIFVDFENKPSCENKMHNSTNECDCADEKCEINSM